MVAIEKTLALQKVAEHQAIQHERGIPIEQTTVGDAFDEFAERVLLRFELVVETLGDFVAVEGIPQAFNYTSDIERLFLRDRE